MLAAIVDADAFLHVALYGLLGALGLVLGFGGALLGLDRAQHAGGSAAARAGGLALVALGGALCLALLATGLWAMTQK